MSVCLPVYPPRQYQKSLSPSERTLLHKNIASTLGIAIGQNVDALSTKNYIATYSKDVAFATLEMLIWKDTTVRSSDEQLIYKRSLLLAEKLALSPPGLDIQTLFDLSISYARFCPIQLHAVFKAAFESNPQLPQSITDDLVPTFTLLLSQQSSSSQGLYAQRKVAECVYSFLRGCQPIPELSRPFSHDKEFMVALASLYDAGMTTIAASYGGTSGLMARILSQGGDGVDDDWERIWVETKVALVDSFHIVLSRLLDDLSSTPAGSELAADAERAFDIVFALTEVPPASSTNASLIPFLNQSLLADYQQCYSLSRTLVSALEHAEEKDPRLDLLESTLESLETNPKTHAGRRNPGALKIILQSGIRDTKPQSGNTSSTSRHGLSVSDTKGKGRAVSPAASDLLSDPDLDIKATQVLDILPDTSVNHIKLLLAHDKYGRNPERVIEALLEGTAMTEEELEKDMKASEEILYSAGDSHHQAKKEEYDISRRKNVFDDEVLDVSRLRVGKKDIASGEILRDRSYIEQMKADILRRAEEMSDEEEEFDPFTQSTTSSGVKGKNRSNNVDERVLGPDDEDVVVNLRVGDGEDSGDDDGEEETDEDDARTRNPETLIELAYLSDPKVFERDAATRRSKARADLRAQTGWTDEQIEGWKVMLERTPGRKERLHEFRGNEKGLEVQSGKSAVGRGSYRGGRGRGGGRGGGSSAQERAWKDKNKASRANHNRKRGHDKKFARAGAGPSI